MSTWGDFEQEAQELATAGRERIEGREDRPQRAGRALTRRDRPRIQVPGTCLARAWRRGASAALAPGLGETGQADLGGAGPGGQVVDRSAHRRPGVGWRSRLG